jgi:uncharacterized repeat protein (TIGR03803 family)
MKQFCRALLLLAIALAILLSAAMQAQTFTVLHTFTGANDGDEPQASLTLDGAGNLYGTASYGGSVGMGTVFKLTDRPSGWALTTLYSFSGGSDGAIPLGGVIFGPDGSLYGDTSAGGDSGYGTVFNLKPQPRVCNSTECPWLKTTLYQFTDEQDGSAPMGNLLANAAGDLFGTTSGPFGSVYKLTPLNHSWIYSLLYSFNYFGGPYQPYAGVISDTAGNLFGTTANGGDGECYRGGGPCGTVYELSPVGSSWRLNVLYEFQGRGDGGYPRGALIADRFGNLYGANTAGVVFMLTPGGGSWAFNSLYQFQGPCPVQFGPSCGPWGALVMDASGSLYGTAYLYGAYSYGSVFKLTPSNGGWIYTDLYDFTNGSDGSFPMAGVTLDANGSIYGTTEFGGSSNFGVVFEITP